MEIIIVGGGKVGVTLVEQLSREGHNITLIDRDGDKLQRIANTFDVMGVAGNGASYSTQMEAGVETADLLVAVTGSDELNLLCCLFAKKAGNCQTIARVCGIHGDRPYPEVSVSHTDRHVCQGKGGAVKIQNLSGISFGSDEDHRYQRKIPL